LEVTTDRHEASRGLYATTRHLFETNFLILGPRGTSFASNETKVGKTARTVDFRTTNRYISETIEEVGYIVTIKHQ